MLCGPYSNIFLIHKSLFSISGGYDSRFRGHGSDDFEYLLRLSKYTRAVPEPVDSTVDLYGPLKSSFFENSEYKGFRRLFEAMSIPAELAGLRIAHLWHPRPMDNTWYQNNDWKRDKFKEIIDPYTQNDTALLSIDNLQRDKRYLCFCRNPNEIGYFLPFRAASIELIAASDFDPSSINQYAQMILSSSVDGLIVFNPYMDSNKAIRPLIELAKKRGLDVAVIERGALPKTIYYSDDVCYIDPTWSSEYFEKFTPNFDELKNAYDYIKELRSGASLLENADSYEDTYSKYSHMRMCMDKIVFIPLQMREDMAIRYFNDGYIEYSNFIESLEGMIKENPDVTFLVKPHPLSKEHWNTRSKNLYVLDRVDNVHAVLDIVHATICYNSGVGLISAVHGVPTFILGNAFYNFEGIGNRCQNSYEFIRSLKTNDFVRPDGYSVLKLIAWYTGYKYSTFDADDVINEFENRKAHGYKNICVNKFVWKDRAIILNRLSSIAPFSFRSYQAYRARIRFSNAKNKPEATWSDLERWGRENYLKGNFAYAGDLFDRAYNQQPERVSLLRRSAESYLLAGNREQAVQRLISANKQRPNNKNIKQRLFIIKSKLDFIPFFGRGFDV